MMYAEGSPFHGKVLEMHAGLRERAEGNRWRNQRDSGHDRELDIERFRQDNRHHLAMIATDLMGGGVDIPTIRFLLNYDPPLKPRGLSALNRIGSAYVHWIGRAAPDGKRVFALSFIKWGATADPSQEPPP